MAGAIGSLAKDIINDNKLTLPKINNGELCLGFIGGIILGGITGYYVDGSIITAAMAGYTGSSLIPNLIATTISPNLKEKKVIETLIRAVATDEGIDPDLAVKVAECESSLNPEAKNTNSDGSIDRGIFQINTKWHPEVTDAQAFSIVESTKFFCKQFKAGMLSDWNASRTCWQK